MKVGAPVEELLYGPDDVELKGPVLPPIEVPMEVVIVISEVTVEVRLVVDVLAVVGAVPGGDVSVAAAVDELLYSPDVV